MKPGHVELILNALRPLRNRYTSEIRLQDAIAGLFDAGKIGYVREHSLTGAERIDFHCPFAVHSGTGGIAPVGLEVKMDGGRMSHLRQLYRYAPHYADLILITTQASCPEDQDLTVTPLTARPTAPGEPLFDVGAPHVCRLHVINISLRL